MKTETVEITPEERAAQIWCEPQHEKKEMDVHFAASIAAAIRAAVVVEREGCAQIADNAATIHFAESMGNNPKSQVASQIAKAIRAQK